MRRDRIATRAGIGLIILLTAGVTYEQIGRVRDRTRYPQIGKSVDIGGRSLNIHCLGQGSPTVVFDTASHQAGYSWAAVQRQVAAFTQACWYDRAGYGWSEPGPRPRSYEAVATDLHKLLHAASLPPPYLFVAAGEAGLHVRVYHGFYPTDVAGVVLVDSPDVDPSDMQEPEFLQGPWARHFGSHAIDVRRVACAILIPVAFELGLARLKWQRQGPRRTPTHGLTEEQQRQLDFLSDNPTALSSGELCQREESFAQARSAGGFGSRPLTVVASRQHIGFRPDNPAWRKAVEVYNDYWINTVQPRLARLSTRGRLVVVEDGPPLGRVAEQIKLLIS